MRQSRRQPRHRWQAVLALLLAALVVLAGCGSGGQPAGGGGGGQGGEAGSGSGGESASDSGAAPQGGTIKIGMVLAMTGAGSFYGQVMSRGAQTAVDQINEQGGVEGYTLELVIEDHKSGDANAALTGGRKLLDVDQVPVILSSYTAPTLAIQPLAVEKGVLLFNGGGIGEDLIGKEALYNTRMLGTQIMPAVVRWAAEEQGAKRFATIFWNDAAGQSINQVVKDVCAEVGCEVVAEEPHDIGATNYSAQLARVKAANPDAIVIGSYGNDVGYIVNQARAQGINALIMGNEWSP
ncbi:MAG TPA: ABC transporter substrate-binding protein, partial [Bacillota bacterium]